MEFIGVKKEKGENNKQFTYRVLKENIMNLSLKPGEEISEIEIGEALNVSRTPVREAIVKLKEEKLINVFPQKGSLVSRMNLKLIEEAAFLREICDKEILKMVCQENEKENLLKELKKNLEYQKIAVEYDENTYEFFRLDNLFHKIIYDHCDKTNIWKVIQRLSTHYDRLRLFDTLEKMNFLEIINQHEGIISVLENAEKEKVDYIVENHLFNFKKILNNFREKFPNYFDE